MEGVTCSFCLGGDTDIPPFGRVEDAQDLIYPCRTCSITTHRKCLIDWINSLPVDRIHELDSLSLSDDSRRRDLLDGGEYGIGQAPDNYRVHIHISSQLINSWINNMASQIWPGNDYSDQGLTEGRSVETSQLLLLLTPCPQCKLEIIFSIRKSSFLTLLSVMRMTVTKGVQYGGIMFGVASVFTGILSMSYVGLTSCGLRMMDTLLPGPIFLKLLSKKTTRSKNSLSYISQFLLGSANKEVDSLELALSEDLIDPFKFSRVPIFPIVLYRMRSSSFISCLFGDRKKVSFHDWITEFMINGYISSLGEHQLVKGITRNFSELARLILTDPRQASRSTYNLLRGLDLSSYNNIIAMLIPLRWAYDLFFHLTLNKLHFLNVKSLRPREIANNLSPKDLDSLERTNIELGDLKMWVKNTRRSVKQEMDKEYEASLAGFSDKIGKLCSQYVAIFHRLKEKGAIKKYMKLRFLLWLRETKACFRNDYSVTFLYKSSIMRLLTTFMWPFISSKVANLLFKSAGGSANDNKKKLIFNMMGMLIVVFAKDCINLFLSYKKAKQVSQMAVLSVEDERNDENSHTVRVEEVPSNFPGNFP